MKNKNWRDVAEIVGMISIVVGLILLAREVRHANNIAKTQMIMDLAAQANEFNSATYENADVANLLSAEPIDTPINLNTGYQTLLLKLPNWERTLSLVWRSCSCRLMIRRVASIAAKTWLE